MRTQSLRTLLIAALLGSRRCRLSPRRRRQPRHRAGGRACRAAIATTACGTPVRAPAALPPAGSPPFIWIARAVLRRQGNVSTVETRPTSITSSCRPSLPSQGIFVPYDETAEQTDARGLQALWATNFLEDLSIEVTDYTFPNGVVGKLVVYHMEERERVKIVDYRTPRATRSASSSARRSTSSCASAASSCGSIRSSTRRSIRRVEAVLREMMAEKGFTNAEIDHKVTPVAGGPKLVNVTFTVGEGPKIKIRDVEFVGNTAISDGTLQRKMKENKPKGILSFITGGGTYKEAKFEEDAAKVVEYYQQRGLRRRPASASPSQGARGLQGRQDAVGAAAHPGDRGHALPRRRARLRRQQAGQERGAAHALQGRAGRLVQPQEASTTATRRRRRSTAAAATWSSPPFPI